MNGAMAGTDGRRYPQDAAVETIHKAGIGDSLDALHAELDRLEKLTALLEERTKPFSLQQATVGTMGRVEKEQTPTDHSAVRAGIRGAVERVQQICDRVMAVQELLDL